MATLRMALKCPFLATNNATKLEKTPTNQRKEEVLTDIGTLLENVAGGRRSQLSGQAQPSLILSIDENCTAASGTVTCASVSANDTVQVGAITFTAVNGGTPTSIQFDMSGTDTATGTNLAAAIAAHPTTRKYVTAASLSGAVTVTAVGPALGVLGNALILKSSNNTRLAVVAMASGADDATGQTYSF